MNFAGFAYLLWGLEHLRVLFACQKVVFWHSSLYLGNKTPDSCHLCPLDDKIVTWQVVNS
jgi:hypothetical protein